MHQVKVICQSKSHSGTKISAFMKQIGVLLFPFSGAWGDKKQTFLCKSPETVVAVLLLAAFHGNVLFAVILTSHSTSEVHPMHPFLR